MFDIWTLYAFQKHANSTQTMVALFLLSFIFVGFKKHWSKLTAKGEGGTYIYKLHLYG